MARYHDVTAKIFLGARFPANQTAQQDLDQALDVIFEHPNLAPFISRQLIQQLVTSNPSPAYVADIAAVFDNGASAAAIWRGGARDPHASRGRRRRPHSGKLSEPVLFAVSLLRALNATVTDHPFMSNAWPRDGPEGVLPALGLQLLLARLPRARHRARRRSADPSSRS